MNPKSEISVRLPGARGHVTAFLAGPAKPFPTSGGCTELSPAGTMYAKLFRQIYESSIAEDYETRHVFMDMVVLADSDGVVDMTPEAISRITNVPLDKIRIAILKLESPDLRSRTPDYEGCRLIRLDDHRDWGWVIVNYAKFRGTATEEKRRELTRLRVKKLRERQALKNQPAEEHGNACNALHSVTSASPSPSPSALQGGVGDEVEFPETFPKTADDAVKRSWRTGCDDIFVTDVWNRAAGRGGRDSRDVPVRVWENYIQTQWSYERARREESKTKSANGVHRKPFISELKAQMDAKQRQCDSHPANPQSISYRKNCTDLEKAAFRQARKEIQQLNTQIANGGSNA